MLSFDSVQHDLLLAKVAKRVDDFRASRVAPSARAGEIASGIATHQLDVDSVRLEGSYRPIVIAVAIFGASLYERALVNGIDHILQLGVGR